MSSRTLRTHVAGTGARLVLGVAGIFVALLALEIGLRVSGSRRQFAEHDATIGYTLTPHFTRRVPVAEHAGGVVVFRTNNLGLRRDRDTAVPKADGTRRVLVLGDSQSEGIVANAESYSSLLEAALNTGAPYPGKRTRPLVEVLDAAVSGYSPLLEYLWLEERGLALEPDLIILALYVGNDIAELNMHHEDFGGFGPQFTIPALENVDGRWRVVPPGAAQGWWSRLDWLLQTHLRVYAMAHRALVRPARTAAPALSEVVHVCPGCLQSMWQAFLAHGNPDALAEGFAKLDYLIGQFQHAAQDLHSGLLIVVIPTKLEVEGGFAVAGVRATMEIMGLRYDPVSFDDTVRQRIIGLAAEHDVPVADLLPTLQSTFGDRAQPLFWSQDWHLNVEGHQVVAEYLLPRVLPLLDRR